MLRTVSIDAAASLEEMTPQLAASLDQLMPFGPGHSRPSVWLRGVRVEGTWLTDGRRRVRVRRRVELELCLPRERYDVVATLHEVRGEIALSIVDAKLSSEAPRPGAAAPSSRGLF